MRKNGPYHHLAVVYCDLYGNDTFCEFENIRDTGDHYDDYFSMGS